VVQGVSGRGPLIRFVLRRLAIGIVLAWVVSVLVFIGTQILPGNAATALLGKYATPSAVAALKAQLHLNESGIHQYWSWISGVLQGHLGTSLTTQQSVSSEVGYRVVNTLILAGVTLIVLIPLSFMLGTVAALKPGGKLDVLISGTSLGAIAVPEFVTGTILAALLGVSLALLPPVSLVAPGADPLDTPNVLVLPVLTLVLAGLAFNVRMVRVGVIRVLDANYVTFARLNGVPNRRIMNRYVLRNALGPSIQVFALTVLWLVGGIVVTENVFQYPGLGQGIVQAVTARDIPTVQALAVGIGAFYIAVNIMADLAVVLLIPKLRTSRP
jgi:peptide/nickel transport system permease protein